VLGVLSCVLLGVIGLFGAAGHGASADPASAAPPEVPLANTGVLFADDPSIVDSRPLAIESWSRLAGDDALALNFTVGSPDCYGVHAVVAETAEAVVVELRAGTRPSAVGRMCIMIAVFGRLDVPLQVALGDRVVLSVS
jgi:hypothetical protein